MSELESLQVELGERSYPIVFGGLSGVGGQLQKLLGVRRAVVVSNDVVGPLYRATVASSLEAVGWRVEHLEIPDGEHRKSLETWQGVVAGLLDLRVDRSTVVVALGGGVTGDIVGFAAASTLRGLPLVQIPTTLLSMVDSSVGGKTGVNSAHGKNLIGAFYQPRCVYIDVEALGTLEHAELCAGFGEVVKHALLADRKLFDWLEENSERLLALDPTAMRVAVRSCCEIKAAVVAEDERESGWRAVLNLGHTIGHAVEKCAGYGSFRHGEAVAIGLLAEATMALDEGMMEASEVERLGTLLRALGLPIAAPQLAADDLISAIWSDKKLRRGTLSLPLPRGIGAVKLLSVEPSALSDAARRAVFEEER